MGGLQVQKKPRPTHWNKGQITPNTEDQLELAKIAKTICKTKRRNKMAYNPDLDFNFKKAEDLNNCY